MNILELQVFVSLMLVAGAVLLFVFTVRARTFEHSDRLALAPLEDDLAPPPAPVAAISAPPSIRPAAAELPSNSSAAAELLSISSAAAELRSSVARTPQEGE